MVTDTVNSDTTILASDSGYASYFEHLIINHATDAVTVTMTNLSGFIFIKYKLEYHVKLATIQPILFGRHQLLSTSQPCISLFKQIYTSIQYSIANTIV